MSIQTETDAKILEPYESATVADLERGIANAERMEAALGQVYRPTYQQRSQRSALRKHADLLRQELKARQDMEAVVA